MKNLQTALVLSLSLFALARPAFAQLNAAQLTDATKLAVEHFLKNNEHKEHLYGFKTWKSGDDAKVKVYVQHDGMDMSFDYHCMVDGEKLVCHAL